MIQLPLVLYCKNKEIEKQYVDLFAKNGFQFKTDVLDKEIIVEVMMQLKGNFNPASEAVVKDLENDCFMWSNHQPLVNIMEIWSRNGAKYI